MLSPLDYALWTLTVVLQVGVVVCAVRARSFLRFFPLNFYMLAACASDVGRYVVLQRYGFTSHVYFSYYYCSDALLTVCLFFVLMGLFSHVFHDMGAKLPIRLGALLVLGLIAAVTYAMVSQSEASLWTLNGKAVSRFAGELSQNLHFVGVALTYVLWRAVKKVRESRTQVIQFALSLGVYFSAFAAAYAVTVLHPGSQMNRFVSLAMGFWLPLAWSYTFLKVPVSVRLETARLTVPAAAGSQ